MKLNKLVLVALMALGAVACDKNDGEETSKAPKSVSLKLANVKAISARSGDGKPIVAPEGGTVKATISDFHVFFTDGINLYEGKSSAGETTEHAFTITNNQLPENIQFHFLPYSVNKVIVVGNAQANSSDFTNVKTYADLTALKKSIDDQQDIEKLILWGEEELTFKNNEDHGNLYQASVNVVPLIARFEIAGFTCNFSDPAKYSAIELKQIAVNNYYKQATISGAITSADLSKADTDEGNIMKFLVDGTRPGWSHDVLAATLTSTSNTDDHANAPFYYHVYGDVQPEFVLQVVGDNMPLFVVTKGFIKNGENTVLTDFAAGKIYKLNFTFDDTVFEQPQKCVNVTVDVVAWEIVPVTPAF